MKNYFTNIFLFCMLLSGSLIGQSKSSVVAETFSTENEKLMISQMNTHGELDTFDLFEVVKGKDKVRFFIDQDGERIDYQDFQNKVVLLDFWFLRCKPCIKELPGLEYLNKKINSDDFVLITFANDPLEEIESKLLSKKRFKIKIIPQIFLVSKLVYPLKIVVDKKSRVIDTKSGGNTGDKSVEKLIARYMPLITAELEK